MKKEEILAKSRAEKQDEGVEYIANKGMHYGVKAMSVVTIALVLFNFWQGKPNDMIFAVYWIYAGFELIGKYRASRKRTWLFCGVLGVITGITFGITYVIGVL